MSKKGKRKDTPTVKKGGKWVPALCRILGTLILVSAFAVLIPTAAPRLLGYEVYEVVSASMEPEIPVGSLILVKPVDPVSVQEGDIIAYQKESSVITHRVEQNRQVEGEFLTKGDANEMEDLSPVPYASLIGKVTLHVPALGTFMRLLTGTVGKIYMAVYVVCGILFYELAARLSERGREKEE